MSTTVASPRTAVRWQISFLDRMNMSVAARYIQLSAYVVSYALFQIPGGPMGDRFGPRRVLAFAVAWWSVFTGLTAMAPELGRLSGLGLILTGIGFGGAISQPLTAVLMSHLGWRWPFVICGLLGVPAVLVWWWYGRDRPEDHPRVGSSELAFIRPRAGTDNRPEKRRGSFKPADCGHRFRLSRAVTTPLGGLASDACVRRLPAIAGTFGSGFLLIAGARVAQAELAVILLGLTAGSLNFALTNWWATVNDISPGDSGALSVIMNKELEWPCNTCPL